MEEKLCCYAAHTNYDVAKMAQLSAECLDLQSSEILSVSYCDSQTGQTQGYGRVGDLRKEMALQEYARSRKKSVFFKGGQGIRATRTRRSDGRPVLPGSGKSMISDAIKARADVMVTGDIDHHTGIDAAAQGIAVIGCGTLRGPNTFLSIRWSGS